MGEARRAAHAVGLGLYDALAVTRLIDPIKRSRQLRHALLNCCVLNGALFLGSHLLWSYGLLRLILWLYPGNEALVGHVAHTVYVICWLGPLYVLSTVLNSKWYRESAFLLQQSINPSVR